MLRNVLYSTFKLSRILTQGTVVLIKSQSEWRDPFSRDTSTLVREKNFKFAMLVLLMSMNDVLVFKQ